jgi:hypothetical protein
MLVYTTKLPRSGRLSTNCFSGEHGDERQLVFVSQLFNMLAISMAASSLRLAQECVTSYGRITLFPLCALSDGLEIVETAVAASINPRRYCRVHQLQKRWESRARARANQGDKGGRVPQGWK